MDSEKFDKKVLFTSRDPKFSYQVEEGESLLIEIIDDSSASDFTCEGNLVLKKNAYAKIVMVSFGGTNAKAEISATLEDQSRFICDVAAVSNKKFSKVFDIKATHLEGNSYSFTKMYGVMLDDAKLSFLGTSDIKKGAKKTWTRQEGKIADLSENGKGEVSPILKIDEDDIKASHGAALGKIPEDSLFYMMSRGLTMKQASALMTIGYLKPIVEEISEKDIREKLVDYVSEEGFSK